MEPAKVFEETYRNYLDQLADIDLAPLADGLGIEYTGQTASIALFNRQYNVSTEGVTGEDGQRPNFGACIILFKYILMGSKFKSQDNRLVTFKDFKESGPLTHYFAHTVEGAIARHFTGRPLDLIHGCQKLGGRLHDVDWAYQAKIEIDALPKIPLYVLFNDAEEGFAAQTTLLFRYSAETYLDMESVAMLGGELARLLLRY
jgi:hypothetical protein